MIDKDLDISDDYLILRDVKEENVAMIDKDLDMSDDYLILRDVKEENGITEKQMAMGCGRGVSTIYRYLNGEATIPSHVWRWLYAKTHDHRIVQLITGEVPVMVVPTPEMAGGVACETAVAAAAKAELAAIENQKAVCQILLDGKIDGADREAIGLFSRTFPGRIENLYRLKCVLERQYKQALNGC